MFSFQRMAGVLRHELRLLFYAPLTCLFLLSFLLLLNLCIFQVADFYATDEASMRSWQTFIPWLGLVFIPTLAMRAWPDEYTDRSIELSMTLPLATADRVVAKYLAGNAVIMVMLLFTFPFTLTLAYLGQPDWGAVASAYLAAWLLLGLYYALALWIAALVREPVSVFVTGVLVLFVVLIAGTAEFNSLLDHIIPAKAIAGLVAFSPKYYFDLIAAGLIALFAVGYFVLATALALYLCTLAVNARRHGRLGGGLRARSLATAAGVALLVVLAQLILSNAPPVALDATEQKEFTLSRPARDQLSRLPAQIHLRYFWSASQISVPAAIQSHARRITNLLERMAYHADGKLHVRTVDPVPDTDAELAAVAAGMQVVPMSSGDYFYLGLEIQYRDRVKVLPYIDIRREHFLESDLMLTINRIADTKISRIALLSPLIPPGAVHTPRPGLSFIDELKRRYDLALVPFFDRQLPDNIDVLIVLQSAVLKRSMLRAIDRFVVGGGTLIALLDPYVRSDQASNQLQFRPSEEINDISDLLLAYGIRYVGDRVVGDQQLGIPVATDRDTAGIGFPYWLRFERAQLQLAAATGNLNRVLLAEPGALEIVGDNVTPLIKTTSQSGTTPRRGYADKSPQQLAGEFQTDNRQRMVAAHIRGRIRSAYSDLPGDLPGDPPANPAAPDAGPDAAAGEPANVFVIADVDWLFDRFALQPSVPGDQAARPINDNLALLGNLIAYGTGGELNAIRARGQLSRPFTRVEQLLKQTQQVIRYREKSTYDNLVQLQQKLDEIRAVAGVEQLANLPSPLKQQALALQSELTAMQRDLRKIRATIRERIDRLGRRLALINLAAAPLLVLLLWSAVMLFRRRA